MMTLLTVLLHIWILWTLCGGKLIASHHQICCSRCYSVSPTHGGCINECVFPCVPMERCMSDGVLYEGYCCCRMTSNSYLCCSRDCSNYPPQGQHKCMNDSVICCTNNSIPSSTSQQINKPSFSINMEMSTSLLHTMSSYSLSAISNRMSSSQEKVVSWSGQNHISKTTTTSHSSIHVTLPPVESSKFNQNIIFSLVGGLGGSILIVLVLSVIIIVQCVTLYKRRKMGAYPAVREEDEEKEYSNPAYAVSGITLETCQPTSANGSEVQDGQLNKTEKENMYQIAEVDHCTDPYVYDDIDKYFKSPNDEDYVNPGYDVSGKREPWTNYCNIKLLETSTTHSVDEKEKLTLESTEYDSVLPGTDHIATTPDPVPETQENSNLEHS